MNTLTKIGDWYLGSIKAWQTDLYGYEMESGVGDLISNNTALIKRTKDRSIWAYECVARCFNLLSQGKRWTDDIDKDIPKDRQCKTRLCSFLNKTKFHILKKLGVKRFMVKSRSQGDMTRDPYIYAIACVVDMDLLSWVHDISIPWYLWRATTWKWHKYLKNPTEKKYRRWERAERISAMFKAKDFVHELKRHRREAAWKIENKRRADVERNE